MADESIKKLSYAEATEELESIVSQLEAGNLELEDSLAYYKRGQELVKELEERLKAAKQEVEKLAGENETDATIIDEEIA